MPARGVLLVLATPRLAAGISDCKTGDSGSGFVPLLDAGLFGLVARCSTTTDVIRPARTDDLPMLRGIEAAAGEVFRDLGMDAVANDDLPTIEELAKFLAMEGVLVTVDDNDRPVAYLLVEPLEGWAHVEQVSVRPDHARQRLGSRLLDEADAWARQHDLAGLTLTTFEHVPWNAPYYRRLGFHTVEDADLSSGLRAIREAEAARGLDRWPRVAMMRNRGD